MPPVADSQIERIETGTLGGDERKVAQAVETDRPIAGRTERERAFVRPKLVERNHCPAAKTAANIFAIDAESRYAGRFIPPYASTLT